MMPGPSKPPLASAPAREASWALRKFTAQRMQDTEQLWLRLTRLQLQCSCAYRGGRPSGIGEAGEADCIR